MKQTRYFAAAIAVVLAAASSCNKETINPGPEPSPAPAGTVNKVFTATLEEPTKGSLSGLTPTWEVGDSLIVLDDVNPNQVNKFKVTDVQGRSVTFEGSVSDGATSYKAVYPYAAAVDATTGELLGNHSGDSLKVTISGYQNVTAGRYIDPRYMVSVGTSTDGNFQFKNAVSIVKFTITRSDVSFVRIFAAKGNYWVKPSDGTLISKVSYNPIRLRTEGTDYFTPGDYYITLQPCTVTGMTVVCSTAAGYKWKQNTTTKMTFKRNGGYDLGVVDDGNTLLAKWMFRTPYNSSNTNANVGYDFTQSASDAAGYTGYGLNKRGTESNVPSYFAGDAKIRFYNTGSGDNGNPKRAIEGTSKACANSLTTGYCDTGDYYEFAIKDSIPSGTKLHLWLGASVSASDTPNWSYQVWDGTDWSSATTLTIKKGDKNVYTPIDVTWTTTALIKSDEYVPFFKLISPGKKQYVRIYDSPTDGEADMAPYLEIVTE